MIGYFEIGNLYTPTNGDELIVQVLKVYQPQELYLTGSLYFDSKVLVIRTGDSASLQGIKSCGKIWDHYGMVNSRWSEVIPTRTKHP